ncbi:hypothetical protein EUTSA_v10022399mg [Eutrema salsugineum]|uniref:Late embryogenesis abundant protein LEA-2 subgroup domain-containing protein n=2 Tax=Eutrema salsugineum TaxID=72664 RepID=V4M673_EUTSA|nr:hypothetical protein EUTSA_v10022399mg [Eutrema salsugineum]
MSSDGEDDLEWYDLIPGKLELALRFMVMFLFIVSFIALLLWFCTFVHHFPRCSVHYFYISALNKSLNSPHNTTLNFMLRLKNINPRQRIYYDDVHLSFSNSSLFVVAKYTVPRFYQGHEKSAKKWGQAQPLDNVTVLRAVLPNGSAVFRVDLKTQLKYKFMFWKTRRYRFEASVS